MLNTEANRRKRDLNVTPDGNHPKTSLPLVWARAVAESSQGIIVVDASGGKLSTIYVNPAYENITGYSSAELLGKPPGRILHGEDTEQADIDKLRAAIAAQKPITVTLRNYRKDGRLFWNELTISPVHDAQGQLTHFFGLVNDVTARKNAEDALIVWTARIEALTSMSADGLVAFDENDRLAYTNTAFLELTGLPANAINGLSVAELDAAIAHHCDPEKIYRPIEAKMLGINANPKALESEHEIYLQQPHKKVLLRRALKTPFGIYLLLYFHDITARYELDEMKSRFLNTAAHELRTPLTSILGYSQLLLAVDYDSETRRDHLETIARQATRTSEIVTEMLDLNRIDNLHSADFVFDPHDLRSVVTEARKTFHQASARIILNTPPETLLARVDYNKIVQAVTHLLDNALKFSPADQTITLSVGRDDNESDARVKIVVEDQGIGISRIDLARLGERFFRVDTSGTLPGAGLGIALVKTIVDLHKGTFTVHSTPAEGTCVTLSLPALPLDDAGKAPA